MTGMKPASFCYTFSVEVEQKLANPSGDQKKTFDYVDGLRRDSRFRPEYAALLAPLVVEGDSAKLFEAYMLCARDRIKPDDEQFSLVHGKPVFPPDKPVSLITSTSSSAVGSAGFGAGFQISVQKHRLATNPQIPSAPVKPEERKGWFSHWSSRFNSVSNTISSVWSKLMDAVCSKRVADFVLLVLVLAVAVSLYWFVVPFVWKPARNNQSPHGTFSVAKVDVVVDLGNRIGVIAKNYEDLKGVCNNLSISVKSAFSDVRGLMEWKSGVNTELYGGAAGLEHGMVGKLGKMGKTIHEMGQNMNHTQGLHNSTRKMKNALLLPMRFSRLSSKHNTLLTGLAAAAALTFGDRQVIGEQAKTLTLLNASLIMMNQTLGKRLEALENAPPVVVAAPVSAPPPAVVQPDPAPACPKDRFSADELAYIYGNFSQQQAEIKRLKDEVASANVMFGVGLVAGVVVGAAVSSVALVIATPMVMATVMDSGGLAATAAWAISKVLNLGGYGLASAGTALRVYNGILVQRAAAVAK